VGAGGSSGPDLNDLVLSTTRLALQDAAGHISDEAAKPQPTPGTWPSPSGRTRRPARAASKSWGQDATAGINGRVFSSLPYAIVMNDGRRPGAPISREGIDAIGLWAQRKLGLSATKAEHAKFGIAAHMVAQGHPRLRLLRRGRERGPGSKGCSACWASRSARP
jgi:hypothetical protein